MKIDTTDAPALREILPDGIVTRSQSVTFCGRLATVCTRQDEEDPPVTPPEPPPISTLYWNMSGQLEDRPLNWYLATGLDIVHTLPIVDIVCVVGSIPPDTTITNPQTNPTLEGPLTQLGVFTWQLRVFDTSGHYADLAFQLTVVEE